MENSPQTRRAFGAQTLGSLLTFSLLETLCRYDAFAAEARPSAVRWVAGVNELGRDLKGRSLDQLTWQAKVEELLPQVDMAGFLELIDFDRLTSRVAFAERGERSLRPVFPKVEGLPTELSFGCRNTRRGNGTSCAFIEPRAGTWYVMIRAQSALSDVTLTGCLIQGSGPTVFIIDNAKKDPKDAEEKGARYIVLAAAEDLNLRQHLNHEVRITGKPEGMVPVAGTKVEEKDLPKFNTKAVVMVSNTCALATAR